MSGRKSQAAGIAFESWINGQHETANVIGILAFVEKTEAHSRVIHGRVQFAEPGVADYIGCLVGNGRCMAVEAKSTADDHLMRSAVSTKQAKNLDSVAAAGGLALLLVEFRGQSRGQEAGRPVFRRYAVPWQEVPWQVLRTAQSVAEDSIQQHRIVPDTCYLERFHPRGKPVGSVGRVRVYASE